jgi:hypothetical protein
LVEHDVKVAIPFKEKGKKNAAFFNSVKAQRKNKVQYMCSSACEECVNMPLILYAEDNSGVNS